MARIYKDRVAENTTSTGTGNFVLMGASAGFQAFASVAAVGDTFDYAAFTVDANSAPTGAWETGTGTYIAGNQIVRAVQESSSANALVDFQAGAKIVVLSENAASIAALAAGGGGGGGGGSNGILAAVWFQVDNGGNVTIVKSVNVSGVVHQGSGDYRINFAVLLNDAYVPVGSGQYGLGTDSACPRFGINRNTSYPNVGAQPDHCDIHFDPEPGNAYFAAISITG